MFSQLGPLFKATFRHAEQSDARQNMPHAVNKDGRRKDDDSQDDSADLWEDSTGVSVAALRTFLINFLNGTTRQTGLANRNAPADATSQTGTMTPAAPETRPPVNTAAARAVGAYQSMADKLEHHHPPAPPVLPQVETPQTDADLVGAADLRLMHQLIKDLEVLEQAGVEMLTIEKADSFVQSLKNAVDKALGR